MKKLRKIETNRPPISDAEINTTKKGFDEVLSNFKTTKFSPFNGGTSIIGWFGGICAAALVGTGIWYLTSQNSPSKKNSIASNTKIENMEDSNLVKNQKINPPFPDKLIFEEYKIDPNKNNQLVTNNGTLISIPAHSFVDSSGNSVTQNVTIKFKDYHNPVDIFLSGIPMEYDSAGINYTFESAGMFQIFAEKDGEKLYLDNGKSIDLEFSSKSEIISNIYYYDTISNNWNYTKSENQTDISMMKDKAEKIDEEIQDYTYDFNTSIAEEKAAEQNEIHRKARVIPTQKRKNVDNNKLFVLKLKDDKGKYRTIEILPNQGFRNEYYTVNWTSSKLIENPGNLFTIILKKGEKELSFIGKESSSENGEKIDNIINTKEKEKLEKIKSQKILADKIEKLRIIQGNIQTLLNNGFSNQRSMTINDLGTWNCDRPVPMPAMAEKGYIQFINDSNQTLYFSKLNIAQVQNNILWSYPYYKDWYFSKKYENIAWFITKNQKIAIAEPLVFRNANKQNQVVIKVYEVDEGLAILKRYLS